MTVKRLAALSLLITLVVCWTLACSTKTTPAPPQFDAAASAPSASVSPAASTSPPVGSVCVVDTDKLKGAMMAVGGTGTGQAQDATVQQIIKLYGASIPQGGSGTGLCQDASLQALYLLIAASLDAGGGGGGGGTVQLDGNVIGPSNNNRVVEVQNQPVEAGTASGQVWIFNGTTWVPGFIASIIDAGTITLAGGASGPANNNVLILDAGAANVQGILPAQNMTPNTGDVFCTSAGLCTVIAIQTVPVSDGGPLSGQALIYNGTRWTPTFASIDAGALTLTGDDNGAANANRVYGISGDGGNTYYVTPSIHLWGADAGQPTITQAASTTGSGQSLYIISQAEVDGGPDAGLYYSPGGIVIETPAPITDGGTGILGAVGTVTLQSGSTPYAVLSEQSGGTTSVAYGAIWLGTTPASAPTVSNFALESVGGNTLLNSSTQASIAIGGALNFAVTTASILVVPETIQWNSAVTGSNPTLTQVTATSDVPTQAMTIQAQSAYPDAGTNFSGAPIHIGGGAGATLNGGTWKAGPIDLDLLAPSAAGTEVFVNVNRAGSPVWQVGACQGGIADSCLYTNVGTPSITNYTLLAVGSSQTRLNGTLTSLYVSGAPALTAGTTIGAALPVGGLGTTPFAWSGTTTVACGTAGGLTTISAAQSLVPAITVTSGVLLANCTIAFGTNAATGWFTVNMSSITTADLASFSLVFTNGAATTTITQAALTSLQATGKNSLIVQPLGSGTMAVY